MSFISSASEHLQAILANAALTNSLVPHHSSPFSNALQQIVVDSNVPSMVASALKECLVSDKPERVFGLLPGPWAGPTTRCGASGLPRRSTGRNGTENKENTITIGNINVRAPPAVNVSQGSMIM
ncbi:hypothetical protein JVU11DRAFT_10672 [Chiua virens]|nr:hypothetical protein JVU11DRAFT_10672 [Chiua virens]